MSAKKDNVTTRMTGYDGSGFVFYFVRCSSRKALADYLKATHTTAPEGADIRTIDAIAVTSRTDVLRGIISHAAPVSPTSANDFIVESHLVVVGDADPVLERRRWYHEIGHVVDWCAQHAACIRREYGIKAEGQCSDEETKALFNEFLLDVLDKFLANSPERGESGLETAMPWIGRTRADRR